jgi:hypothetical protein
VNREGKEEQIWLMYFTYLYENRTIKPAEIVLKREQGISENGGGVNLTQTHCKPMWKCHSENPCATNKC